jgi:WhiB family redox-sensing transcriptional regulator
VRHVTAPLFDGTQPCRDADPELFFPDDAGTAKKRNDQAKAICADCPFAQPCLAYALTVKTHVGYFLDGVWGGTTKQQRTRIRRAERQRRAAA